MKMQRLNDAQIAAILAEINAIHTDSHFVGTSGKHLDAYINKDAVCIDPTILDRFAFEMAHRIGERCDLQEEDVVAIIGAPMGAISFGAMVAKWLNIEFPRGDSIIIRSIYAEKTGKDESDPFKIRDAFGPILAGGKGAITIEDILNTGGSAEKTIAAIIAKGGRPVGVGAICNRGKVTFDQLHCSFVVSLLDVDLKSYTPEKCPMCDSGIPVRTDLGHGQKFLDAQKAKN